MKMLAKPGQSKILFGSTVTPQKSHEESQDGLIDEDELNELFMDSRVTTYLVTLASTIQEVVGRKPETTFVSGADLSVQDQSA